ncbi:Bcr/CflA family efflux MFS transporter [Kribbella antibiotica]|uniref:Bcr/CflA family efflux MFS transporter n=1 Tax=Kribbella antibiotica TaxID=190195 RepID=A0A4R4ZVU3_9ACTN|nr:Bcr/CflA family efflux MFS transporter [Kribbella antibiotica]
MLLIGVLSGLTAVAPFAIDMYVPGFPELGRELGAESSVVQLSISVFLIGLVVGQLVIGPISDRIGRRRLLLPGTALFAVLSVVCALVPTMPFLLAGRFLQGCAGAAGTVLARAVLTDRFAGPRLPFYFSIQSMILGVAPVLGPVIGGLIVTAGGWRAVFWVLAALGVVLFTAVLVQVPESLPPERRATSGIGSTFATMGTLLRDRAFTGYVLTLAFAAGAMFLYIASSSFVFQDTFGLSAAQYGLVFASNAGVMLVANVVFGITSKRIPPERLLPRYIAVALAGAVGLAIQATTAPTLAGTWICLAVVLFGIGGTFPSVTTIAQTIGRSRAGTAAALSGSGSYLFGALTSPLGGGTVGTMSVLMLAALALASVALLFARPWQPVVERTLA